MASKLEFDSPSPPASGGRKLEFDKPPVAPAGPPAPPISGPQSHEVALARTAAEPRPPISQGNIDTRGMPEDPAVTEENKRNARIQAIVRSLQGGEKLPPGPADIIADAASLSTARPLSAAITTGVAKARGSYPGASADEIYKALIQYSNDRNARGDEATGPITPLVRGIASIPASMATGGGSATVNAATKGTVAPTRMVGGVPTNPVTPAVRSSIPAGTIETGARAAVPGFIEGASQHAGSVSEALEGGGINAALSAGTSMAADRFTRAVSPAARRGAEAETAAARGASPDEIAANAKTHYDVLDNQGIAYDHTQTNTLQSGLRTLRSNSVYVPGASPALDHMFDDLVTRAQQGSMSFNELDNARSAVAKIARAPDESTRVAARAINNEIDRLIGSGPPAVNPNNANVQEAYNAARGLWRQKALVEDAMSHVGNVERKIDVKSNVNPNQAMKDEFAAVEKQYDRPGAYDPLASDPEGREMLARLARGGPAQNAMATVGNTLSGKYAPWAGGSAGLAVPHLFGMSPSDNPAGYAAMAGIAGTAARGTVDQAGKAFQRGAANLGQQDVNAYLRHLSGSPQPVPGAAINRDDLARILFAQDLERLAPRFGSAAIGNQQEERP